VTGNSATASLRAAIDSPQGGLGQAGTVTRSRYVPGGGTGTGKSAEIRVPVGSTITPARIVAPSVTVADRPNPAPAATSVVPSVEIAALRILGGCASAGRTTSALEISHAHTVDTRARRLKPSPPESVSPARQYML
jgi:hypothetical protein